jgi:hypothetical protein
MQQLEVEVSIQSNADVYDVKVIRILVRVTELL